VNGSAGTRLRGMTQLIDRLRISANPMERLRLASALWKSITSLSRSEQKEVLYEMGIREADQLRELFARDAGTAATALLRHLDRRFPRLQPGRIVEELAHQPSVPPPRAPGEPMALEETEGESLETEDEPTREETDRRAARKPPATEEAEPRPAEEQANEEVETDQPSEAETAEPEEVEPAASARQPAGKIDRRPTGELEGSGPDETAIAPPIQAADALSEELATSLAEFSANWEKRRFLIDWLHRGQVEAASKTLLETTAGAGLTPQNYVWVVGEMAALGLLDTELANIAVDLSPNGTAAALLKRRLQRLKLT